jgi:hypothetical protein
MKRLLKPLAIFAGILVCGLFFYWAKCQMRVGIFPYLTWEQWIPALNALQAREPVLNPQEGETILHTTFDEGFFKKPKMDVWAAKKKSVKFDRVKAGLEGTWCLRVRSASGEGWSVQQHPLVEVRPGEVFVYDGFARTTGSVLPSMNVILYDTDQKALDWWFAGQDVQSQPWKHLHREFSVPEGVRYIRFRVSGTGTGESYFDDLTFTRKK